MKLNRIYTAIIFCAILLLYAKTIGFDYSYMDDKQILIDNKAFFEAKDVQKVFTTDAFLMENNSSYYRPLQSLSFMADVVISGGLHPWMFHLTNIILFGIIGCLLFFVLLKCKIPQKVSFWGALTFCFHPLFVAGAAWLPARGDLLLTIFCMLLFLCLIKYTERGEIRYLLCGWLSFTLALFCKETAALLPLIVCVYFITMVPNPAIGRKEALLGILMGCSFVVSVVLRSIYTSPGEQITMNRFFANLLSIPVAFSQLILFPIDFSPMPFFTPAKIVVGIFVIVVLFLIIWKKSKQTVQERLFFILWFLFFLFPTFLAIPNAKQFDYLDHRFLLPMIGIFVLVFSLFPASVTKKEVVWIGVVVILGVFSFLKSDVYKGPYAYYDSVIKYNVNNGNAYNVRGLLRFEHEDLAGAMDDFNQAVKLDSTFAAAYHNRGLLKETLHDVTGAMDDFDRALVYNPKEAKIYYAKGCLKGQNGDLAGAIEEFDQAITWDPKDADVYVDRAVAKGKMENITGAISDLNSAIEIDPYHINAYINRAMAYFLVNEVERALQDIETIIHIDPDNESAIWLKNQILTQSNLFVP